MFYLDSESSCRKQKSFWNTTFSISYNRHDFVTDHHPPGIPVDGSPLQEQHSQEEP